MEDRIMFFNKYERLEEISSNWNFSYMTFIFKSGDKKSTNNF